jgi:hypothetical protein
MLFFKHINVMLFNAVLCWCMTSEDITPLQYQFATLDGDVLSVVTIDGGEAKLDIGSRDTIDAIRRTMIPYFPSMAFPNAYVRTLT